MSSRQRSDLAPKLPANLAGGLTGLLSQFVPGYSILNAIFREYFGFDADKVLAIFGFWFGGWAALSYVQNVVWPRILSTFTSTIVVEPEHKVFDDLTKWLSKQTVSQNARLIKVVDKTNLNSAQAVRSMPRFFLDGGDPYGNNNDEDDEFSHLETEDDNVVFNYAASEARRPLRFEPAEGTFYFFHRWQLFILKRYAADRGPFRNLVSEDAVQLSCLGFSTAPLRKIIEQARQAAWDERTVRTSIYRPHPHRLGGRGTSWYKTLTRIARPLDTITMEPETKMDLVADVNAYLKPDKARWYSARGIPYRRGYLFSGPPGCGKTSVSYALAGTFGLDIFVANLSDGKISDQTLSGMLSDLPSRCIVLLEDIDSSGIGREKKSSSDSEDEADHTAKKEKTSSHPNSSRRLEYGVTLSGLLNAIDGVASHEGHVLIMTTNNPELLDAALKRPGRVDKTVTFSLTTRHQVIDIFLRMFSEPKSDIRMKASTTLSELCGLDNDLLTNRQSSLMPAEELRTLAEIFASRIPEHHFSPAEIQGYLLAYKGTPSQALEGIAQWVTDEPRRKEQELDEKKRMLKEQKRRNKALKEQMAKGGYPMNLPMDPGMPPMPPNGGPGGTAMAGVMDRITASLQSQTLPTSSRQQAPGENKPSQSSHSESKTTPPSRRFMDKISNSGVKSKPTVASAAAAQSPELMESSRPGSANQSAKITSVASLTGPLADPRAQLAMPDEYATTPPSSNSPTSKTAGAATAPTDDSRALQPSANADIRAKTAKIAERLRQRASLPPAPPKTPTKDLDGTPESTSAGSPASASGSPTTRDADSSPEVIAENMPAIATVLHAARAEGLMPSDADSDTLNLEEADLLSAAGSAGAASGNDE